MMLKASAVPDQVTRNEIGVAHDSLETFQTGSWRINWIDGPVHLGNHGGLHGDDNGEFFRIKGEIRS